MIKSASEVCLETLINVRKNQVLKLISIKLQILLELPLNNLLLT